MRTLTVLLLGLAMLSKPGGAAAQSASRAFLRSLLVPGWGQRYAGHGRGAAWFLSTEVVLWGGFWGVQRLRDVREDRLYAYAAQHAGARARGNGEGFLDDLGFYGSIVQHNQYAVYADGPAAQLYPVTPEFFWEWDSSQARQRYRSLHSSSQQAERQALYVVGCVVVNHLFAAVHAARSVASGEGAPTAAVTTTPGLRTLYDPRMGMARISLVCSF